MRFRHSSCATSPTSCQLRTDRRPTSPGGRYRLAALHGAVASPSHGLAYHLERPGDLEPAAAAYLRAAEQAADLAEFDAGPRAPAGPPARSSRAWTARQATASSWRAACRSEPCRPRRSATPRRGRAGVSPRPRAVRPGQRRGGRRRRLDVQLIAALGGLWSKEVVAGDLPAARAVTDRLERLPAGRATRAGAGDPPFRPGSAAASSSSTPATPTTPSAPSSEASVLGAGPVPVRLGTPHDYVATLDAVLAVALTLAGDDAGADQALERAVERTARAPLPDRAVLRGRGRGVRRVRRTASAATLLPPGRRPTAVSEIGDRHGFQEHAVLGQILSLSASAMEGDAAACQALEATLGIWRMAGGGLAVPVLLAELAEGFVRVGDLDRATRRPRRRHGDDGADRPAGLRARGARLRAVDRGRELGPADRRRRRPRRGGRAGARTGFGPARGSIASGMPWPSTTGPCPRSPPSPLLVCAPRCRRRRRASCCDMRRLVSASRG